MSPSVSSSWPASFHLVARKHNRSPSRSLGPHHTVHVAERFAYDLMAYGLREAIMEGAVQRVRPKMMTVAAIMGGLLPLMWATGTGADIMKRIAAPMIGGMVSSTVLILLVIPALYALWQSQSLPEKESCEVSDISFPA